MKVLISSLLLSTILLGWNGLVLAGDDDDQDKMLNMLDQLDQLDQLDDADFNDAIKAIYDCSDRHDFKCADKKIAAAKALAFDSDAKKTLKDATDYRRKAYAYAEAQKQQLALAKRQKSCASSCTDSDEYRRCVRGRMSPRNCSEPRSYAPMSNLELINTALQGLKKTSEDYLSQRRQMLKQQEQYYTQVRQENEQRQRLIDEQKRAWEQEQARQREEERQQQAELTAMRQAAEQQRHQMELARKRAEEKAQQEEKLAAERQQRAEERQRQAEDAKKRRLAAIEAHKRAREQEQAEQAAREAAYFAQMKSGIHMAGMNCYGEKLVTGTVPIIRPEVVGCIDVSFSVYCPGSQVPDYEGTFSNMVGNNAGICVGDASKVPKSIGCKAKDFRVVVTGVGVCR